MADILTNLRELSVGFYFYNEKNNAEDITPTYFLDVCKQNIQNCTSLSTLNISHNDNSFSEVEKRTINNGLKLAETIKQQFNLQPNPKIIWLGFDTQSGSTVDLIIDKYKFSLKEQSYILENMGLYKLLNILTDTNEFSRGLHIFEEFAQDCLDDWFNITRDLLIKNGPNPFIIDKDRYSVKGYLEKNALKLEYNSSIAQTSIQIKDFKTCSYKTYKQETTPLIREKVFCKWIKENVEHDPSYIKHKKSCALEAGKNLVDFVGNVNGKSPLELRRFFRIEEEEYYYAKTTNASVKIYLVPNLVSASKDIVIKSFKFEVPKSQLNIYTEIQNTKTGKSIIFRNELRYAHGQLNGTPEAKLYIEKGDLTTIYEQLI